MAHRKRRKPTKAEVKAAADRAEASPDDAPPEATPVPIDPEIVPASAYIGLDDDGVVLPGGEIPREGRLGGRPSDYDPKCLDRVKAFAKAGLTDNEIADLLGVHRSTFYRWQGEHPEFRDALKLGKRSANRRVVNSLYHKAVGYTYDAVKIFQHEGEPVYAAYKEHVAPSDTAAIFWLKNREKEQWRDTTRQEHSGPDGKPIQTEDVGDTEFARRLAFVAGRISKKLKGDAV